MGAHGSLMSDIMDEMDPRMLHFIQNHVNTFTRWDIIRFLYENADTQDTAENLERYIGRGLDTIQQEAGEMTAEGILKSTMRRGHTVYALTDDADTRQVIASLVQAAHERAFRMKLVYHIMRAGGQE